MVRFFFFRVDKQANKEKENKRGEYAKQCSCSKSNTTHIFLSRKKKREEEKTQKIETPEAKETRRKECTP
jgi:hypothetical protein